MRNLYKFTLIILALSPKSSFGADFGALEQPIVIETDSSLWGDDSNFENISSMISNPNTEDESNFVGNRIATYTFKYNDKTAIIDIYDNETYAGLARVLGRTFGIRKHVGLINNGKYVNLKSKDLIDIEILNNLSSYGSDPIIIVRHKNNY